MCAILYPSFFRTVDAKTELESPKKTIKSGFKFGKVPERLYIYSLGTSVER